MKHVRIFIVLAAGLLLMAGVLFQFKQASADVSWKEKVDQWVLDTSAGGQETEALVFLAEQADLSGAANLRSKEEKGQYVYDQLTAVAQETQAPVIAALEAQGAEYQTFWIANMILVRGDAALIEQMARRADVVHIYANPTVHLDEPKVDMAAVNRAIERAESVEWNITHVNAPDVWAMGYDGSGIVVAGQDTGYDWDHPALKNQYRGWDGTTADHNYNWHDSIHSGGGVCGADSPEPCDDHGHGTHTMGTMVGDDGGSNQIGMAPGARWVGCRNMDEGDGTPATYSECYQWFIAPTQLDGTNPDPSKAPHVINNSWGCTVSEGCTDPNVLLTIVNNVVSAGIVTVHAAGNSGSACSTVSEPAAIYDASYTVGATDSIDNIAGFSSRGSVTVDNSGRMKPDISAPGVSIRSSVPGGGYQGGWQGTSMASPHVAGAVALLLDRAPALIGDVAAVETLLNSTAVPRTTTQTCGGVPGSNVPNNTYGWGRFDILNAVNNASPDFTLEVQPVSQGVCIPDNAVYTVTVNALSGITESVTLSANGHPAGTAALFSVNTVVPSFTSTLTISDTAGAAIGSYPIEVVGTTATLSHTSMITLAVNAAVSISPTLTAPANNAVSVSLSPTYSWLPVTGAASYDIEIATDAAFTNIVDSASGLTGASYDTAVTLNPVTQYYWRVRAGNGCGTGEYSAAFTFTTASLTCAVYPGATGDITDNAATQFTATVTNSGTINDVNVLDLVGTHTWVGDLSMQLASPSGTNVGLRTRNCSSADNFDINYDDDAAPGAPPCPPTDGGTYRPDGPGQLADFDGENLSGGWTLTIVDNSSPDSGTLNSWALEICYTQLALLPPTLITPTNGAADVSVAPTLGWSSAANVTDYLVEVAQDNGFGQIVVSATVTTTGYSGFVLAPDTTYYWRVTARDGGNQAVSSTFSFTTMALDETVYLPIIMR